MTKRVKAGIRSRALFDKYQLAILAADISHNVGVVVYVARYAPSWKLPFLKMFMQIKDVQDPRCNMI